MGSVTDVTASSELFSRSAGSARACCGLVLGAVLLVSMATAGSPAADGPLYISTKSIQEETSGRTADSHTALSSYPTETQGNTFLRTVLTTPGATLQSEITGNNGNTNEKTVLGGGSLSPTQASRPSASSDSPPASPNPNSTPFHSSEPVAWSQIAHNPGLPSISVRQTRDLKPLDPNTGASNFPNSPASVSNTVTTSSDRPAASHSTAAPFHTSQSQRVASLATAPQFTVPDSLWRTPADSLPALNPTSQQSTSVFTSQESVTPAPAGLAETMLGLLSAPAEGGQEEQVSYVTRVPDRNEPEKEGDPLPSASLPLTPSSKPEDADLSNAALGIHLLLKEPISSEPKILSPSFVPFVRPHAMSVTAELTLVPAEDFFPTETMEVDFGSGDYLETMSFMGSDLDDFTPVTNLPADMFDMEESDSETYDTSFPSRLVLHLTSMHIVTDSAPSGLSTTYKGGIKTIHASSVYASHGPTMLDPFFHSQNDSSDKSSDSDWSDSFTIEPTELLLPDMNSLEYYSTLLALENASLTEKKSNQTSVQNVHQASVKTTGITPTSLLTTGLSHLVSTLAAESDELDSSPSLDNSSTDVSSLNLSNTMYLVNATSLDLTGVLMTETASLNLSAFNSLETSSYISSMLLLPKTDVFDVTPASVNLWNSSEYVLEPSVAQTHSAAFSTSLWESWVSSSAITDNPLSVNETAPPLLTATRSILDEDLNMISSFLSVQSTSQPEVISSSSLEDVSSFYKTDDQWFISSTETSLRTTASVSTQSTPVLVTSEVIPPTSTDLSPVTSPSPTSSNPHMIPMANHSATTETANKQPPETTVTEKALTTLRNPDTTSSDPTTSAPIPNTPSMTTPRAMSTSKTPQSTTSRLYLCNITRPDMYLVRVGLPVAVSPGYAKTHIKEILKNELNRTVELQMVKSPPDFIFRVVSGPVVYTAVSVINILRQSARSSSVILSVMPITPVPEHQFQVHSVLQFVPNHVDVRFCNFSERIEKGLVLAFAEVRKRNHNFTNFTVHIVNITMSMPKGQKQQRVPVDITFAIRDSTGYLNGSEVSNLLRLLNMVEFSFYLEFPVLQIAEPFHYPELNVTQLLRSSWVKTVLLGVLDQRVSERTFQAKMERRLAQLLGEVLGAARRWKRATSVGNNSVQIVRTSRIEGSDNPLEMIYFVEGPNGERLRAITTASILNRIDVQRAAIVLGYRVQGTLAQPVEKMVAPPSETQNNNLWIIVGVVVPVVVVVLIIIILYWKLCRTDKLEFQPDTMSTVQQRQKLQAPSVKGFDFAKLHLGQHSKDNILVIQEPSAHPVQVKEMTPSENGDVPSPKSKTSSKVSRGARRRGRITPSDAESTVSEPSSGRESAEESTRVPVPSNEVKQPRKAAKNGKYNHPPEINGTDEHLSSASIFEHVDRMSRSSEATKRVSNKIQLIAMQPMPAPPLHNPAVTEKVSETNKINKETALRHKSEIEHHRNKIRLRAKRRGHYDFPAMDDIGIIDSKEHRRIYQKAQMQIDRILDPEVQVPSVFIEPRKSARGKRSPKQRRKHQINGSLTDADKDRLITTDSDGTYKKHPGVNNVAYVSDPDQPPEPRSPSPQDNEVFAGSPPPGHAPPPPSYVPPQPSIEEARQQMHSLLDDAFALVAPTSQGSNAGITLPGVTSGPPSSSPPPRTSRGVGTGQWGSPYTPAQGLSPFSARYAELGMSPPSVPGLLQRQGLGSGYLQSGEQGRPDLSHQNEGLYSSRGVYNEELPSSARPRPVGGTTGAQLHHLTQVGLSSRISAYPGVGRAVPSPSGSSGWAPYRSDEEYARASHNRDAVLGFPDYSSSSVFQMPRTSLREPSAPPAHLQHSTPESPGTGFPSAPPEEPAPSHSSASLIKAIREELMRLSQKQSAVQSFHS
ncbi:UPF0606 protein KIAA1549 [Amia ocellicauda]|uniref:UPF0606 protein KIAA1549 n=1 Tax=Amia ocellicauda TaxID=2972642 RepID=UPI0034642629